MKIKSFAQFLLKFFLVIACSCTILPQASYAGVDGGVGRNRTCNANGIPDGLDYNPFTGGKDVEFVMSNPVCAAVAGYAYANVKINIAQMNSVCGTGSAVPRFTPSPILDVIDIGRGTVRAGSTLNGTCGARVATATTSFFSAISVISVIYGVAVGVYNSSEICGSNWIGPNTSQYINSSPNYKKTVEDTIFGKNGWIDSGQTGYMNFNNKTYREWHYGGVEVEDQAADGSYCPDVSKDKYSNGSYPPQKYYMKGLETGNFNCKQYDILPGQEALDPRDGTPLTAERFAEYRKAYNCCKSRAREYVCIKYGDTTRFCKVGSLCDINGITFSAKSLDNGRLACAETYSLCPYNFALGGGSEQCDFYQDGVYNSSAGKYDIIDVATVTSGNCTNKSEIRNGDCTYNAKAGRCKNYCQFMKHCTKTDLSDYKYISGLTSAYFSSACINMAGDSQNVISFGTGFIAGSARHFSAPVAQCAKETIENIFYNRAGHTACKMLDDSPTNNNCPGGTLYKKGDQVLTRSFFSILQDHMRTIVKMVLTLSIAFFGIKILLGSGEIKKSNLLMYVLKIGLVMYFATGEAWQTMFFDGVYGSSTVFSQMVFKVETAVDPAKRDGCQFGNIALTDGTKVAQSTYPAGKEYLAIFDTLDCKITRYLGFGPEVSVANIVMIIVSGYLVGAVGIYLVLSLFFFGMLLIAATIRALHIFLSSAIAIILMVYVSPLVIPLVLFEKTKGIFKGWVTQLISFSLQPMILFAYLAIFITLMDKTLIGSATFYGQPPFRAISCKEYCRDATGAVVNNPSCDLIGQKLVVPKADSIACMISLSGVGNWPGLSLIGITLPFLIDFFSDHVREKIITLFKAVLLMYFLVTFMDEIPEISSQLLGGASLPSSKVNALDMLKGGIGIMQAIQKRALRSMNKYAPKAAVGARNAINKILEAGNKGKSIGSAEKGSGADAAGSSSGGSDSSGSSGGGSDSSGSSGGGGDSGGSSGGSGADSGGSSGGKK